MPGGRVHAAITAATVSGLIAPYAIVNLDGNPYWYIAGCVVGLLVTPDLDIDKGNISDSFLRKVFPPIQWVWRTVWFPYAKLLPHRSPLSHFPILGTLLRIGYIFLIVNVLHFIFHLMTGNTVSIVWIWNWSFVFGLCHVDTCHFLADISIKSKEQFIGE